ncbi:Desmoglein-2 [Bagarius yarrelli]|uniref:Desmoglein-2 n=1 Tax=Bagarius yarrelli TaxID=175774 RepID=A0A556TT25_BAGYA|nr:Desmoglein-2 [Bagarius yarrelli]
MHVNVKNQPEGPRFMPKAKAIPMSENGQTFDISKVIATYTAIDSDTGLPAKGVKYVKGADRDNWLMIDEKTAEIKLNKVPDRESPYLVNGTYLAEILCISPDGSKTATGTVAIQVEDFNDHCPTLTNKTQPMCTTQEVVYATAEDGDAFPNAEPFTFKIIPEGTDGKWQLEHTEKTTAMLKPLDTLWPGPRQVTLEIQDQQGLSCPDKQVLKLDVCTCDKSGACVVAADALSRKSSKLGSAGIGLLILGFLMLLLIPLLLLLCQCGAAGMSGAFTEIPFDTKEHLISYNTEGQGEDRDVPVLRAETDGPAIMSHGIMNVNGAGAYASGSYGMGAMNGGGHFNNHMEMGYVDQRMNRQHGTMRDGFSTCESGMALDEDFLHDYYSSKSQHLHADTEEHLVPYGYEGKGSPAGSVGSGSVMGEETNLDFLNDLGPKFTTLAEICGGTRRTAVAPSPPPPPRPVIDHSEMISMHSNVANTVNTAANVVPAPTINREENVVVRNTHVVSDVQPVPTLIDVPTHTLMVQPQPMYYMVEPQVSNTVLLAERPAMSLSQGMYVVNNAPMTERVLVQGAMPSQATIGGDRMVLVETHGGATTLQNPGLLQSANLSRSQLLLVDAGAQGGQVLQGTLQRGGISGSQGIMVVDGQGALQKGGISGSQGIMLVEGQGVLQKGGISGSQGLMLVEGQGGSTIQGSLQKSGPVAGASQSKVHVVERKGGNSGITSGSMQLGGMSTAMSQNGNFGLNTSTVQGLPSSRKVVVHEKKVMKTNL